MILDRAAELIASEGISNLSMEQIGQYAGVSKSLVYNYFENLTELLKELLDRELKELRAQQFEAAENASSFEEMVRNITHVYLSYIDERGLILEQLQSDPGISDGHDPTAYGRSDSVAYLGAIVSKQFDIPIELAKAATDISFGLPASAGSYLLRRKMSRQEIEDLTVSMIVGSVLQVRNDYLAKGRLNR